MKIVTAQEALQVLKSNDNVFIHSVAAAPQALIQAMVGRAPELRNVSIYQLHTEGAAPYTEEQYEGIFNVKALFVGANVRKAVQAGRASYIPVFLSEMPLLFRRGIVKLNVALISVSLPDNHGFCTLGPSVDATKAAIETADVVIAQINAHMPRTHGDGFLHISKIDYAVQKDVPLHEVHPGELSKEEMAIGQHIAGIIEDGSTLQMGIGAIPNAVLSSLTHHKDLGIHTEMFSDGVIPLVKSGVINNSKKSSHPGKTVGTFVMGSKAMYDFIDDNPEVVLLDCEYVNSSYVIKKNPRVVAINSAIEIDLSGQVCADSIGSNIYSGVGGQMDFIRGASLSVGGKPIIALPSTTAKGISRITPVIKQGGGVVTTRAHVHYIATEYGIVNLYGKDVRERARLLISIAHPDHREELARQAYEWWKCTI